MNHLTRASACARKAIYELLHLENAEGDNYSKKIKSLKGKYKSVDSSYFDILNSIKDMTSIKVHEQSWDKWDSNNLKFILETLKSVFIEIYVIPSEKKNRRKKIDEMRQQILKKSNSNLSLEKDIELNE